MERHIEATTHVRAPIAQIRDLLRDDPGCVIAEVVSPDDRSARRFSTVVGPHTEGGITVQQDVLVDVGPVEDRDHGVCMRIEWQPATHERLLPTFDGELRAVATEGARSRLALEGMYDVPLGLVGRFGDSIVGRRIARQSVSGLLQDMAERLDRHVDLRNQVPARVKPAPYPVDLRESPHSEYHIG